MSRYKSYTEFTNINKLNWAQVDKMVPKGKSFIVVDNTTNKSWNMIRTTGKFHADVEPVAREDFEMMNSIYKMSTKFDNVDYHGVYIIVDGIKIGAALMNFPHAGSTITKPGTTTKELTGGFKNILNGNHIDDNGPIGHYCLHFVGSIKHTDNEPDIKAQAEINKL